SAWERAAWRKLTGPCWVPARLAPSAGLAVVQASRVARCGPGGKTAMAKQQISKHAKDAAKGDTVAAARPARGDARQTRPRRPGAGSGAAAVQRGASAAAAALPQPIVDSSAMSTDGDATARAASQSRRKPKRADAAAASGVDRPLASTKRA